MHHVDRYEVIRSWHLHLPGTTEPEIAPHFLYHLGPAIVPARTVATGKIYPSGQVWAAIDLLLTCAFISEARRRQEAAGRAS